MVGQYKARIVDTQLQRRLEGIGAVLIEGPKLCGKTTTAEQIAESVLYMALPEDRAENIRMAQIAPGILLQGETPRLLKVPIVDILSRIILSESVIVTKMTSISVTRKSILNILLIVFI